MLITYNNRLLSTPQPKTSLYPLFSPTVYINRFIVSHQDEWPAIDEEEPLPERVVDCVLYAGALPCVVCLAAAINAPDGLPLFYGQRPKPLSPKP